MSFLAHLSARLSAAEDAFLYGRLAEADAGALDVLRDLSSLTNRGSSTGDRRPQARSLLTERQHECAQGCVCRAAVLLHMQCAADGGRGPEAVDEIVTTFYDKSRQLPFTLFSVWIQYHLSLQHYEMCCRELMAYIDAHYSTVPSHARSPSSPSNAADDDSDGGSADERYLTLLELLLFHCLVPLGAHDEALAFLRRGRRTPVKRSITAMQQPTPVGRDERIALEIKEAWINELLELKAAGYTHAVAAAQSLAATAAALPGGESGYPALQTGASSAASTTTASASPASFHAGLSALHDATAYTLASQVGGVDLILPPANLPEANSTALVHVPSSAHDDESAEGESSRSSSSAASTALIPYPSFRPWLPAPFAPDFLWVPWTESLGHRAYAALYKHASPLVANRLRILFAAVWARRPLMVGLLILLVTLRVLTILLRFFRLADLPGVRLLAQQIRAFVRIAFISGTGRSLFA